MNIQNSFPTKATTLRPQTEAPKLRDPNIPADAKVEHDPKTDCFHFSSPGLSTTKCRQNPLKEAAIASAVVGIPSYLGAFQKETFGTVGAVLGGTYAGIGLGLVVGGAVGGYRAYKASNENALYGVLGGLAGSAVGAAGLALLQQPGLWAGYTGAAIATGVAGLGVGAWMVHQNRQIVADARALGWTPS